MVGDLYGEFATAGHPAEDVTHRISFNPLKGLMECINLWDCGLVSGSGSLGAGLENDIHFCLGLHALSPAHRDVTSRLTLMPPCLPHQGEPISSETVDRSRPFFP